MNTEKQNIHGTLSNMRLKSKATFPLARVGSVRALACMVNMKTGRKFTTHINRTDGTIEVTRIQ
jgi:hypothetical protein